jgi:hypothetical protein
VAYRLCRFVDDDLVLYSFLAFACGLLW